MPSSEPGGGADRSRGIIAAVATRDALGERMKNHYELRARTMLPRRSFTIVRIDGRCFSSYTRDLERPFDQQLMDDLAATAEYLVREVEGCRLAYAQSDEISLVLTDFAGPNTQAWFDGNQQKIVSISAALTAARFNQLRPGRLAVFDSRASTIPDGEEVVNYLVWRQQDATRNSVQMAARAHFPAERLHGLSGGELQELLWSEHGVNWNDYPARFKRGTVLHPETVVGPATYLDRRTGQERTTEATERRVWVVDAAPRFTQEREWTRAAVGARTAEQTDGTPASSTMAFPPNRSAGSRIVPGETTGR